MVFPVNLRRFHFVFRGRNRGHDRSLPQYLRVDRKTDKDLPDQCFLVVGIINREIPVITDGFNVPSENPDTHGVKGRYPDTLGAESDQLVDTFPHFTGRLIRKGNREDVPRIDIAFLQKIGNAVCDDARLSGARTGQDQDRAFRVKTCLLLFLIQRIVNTHSVLLSLFCSLFAALAQLLLI